MPCYITRVKERIEIIKPSEEIIKNREPRLVTVGGYTMFSCQTRSHSDSPTHCASCPDFADFLCDYPVGDEKTCDRAMCDSHRHNVAPEIDYCDAHNEEWEAFAKTNKIEEKLKNVIPFHKPTP